MFGWNSRWATCQDLTPNSIEARPRGVRSAAVDWGVESRAIRGQVPVRVRDTGRVARGWSNVKVCACFT
jgi:hypothetical protein